MTARVRKAKAGSKGCKAGRDRSYYITRPLISRAMLATKPEPLPSPTVKRLEDGRWAVLAPDGAELAIVATNSDAWAWIDRNGDEGREELETYRRIKTSMTFS